MFKLCVFGGGRWAKVIVSVISSQLPRGAKILWVTSNNYNDCLNWVSENPLGNDISINVVNRDICSADKIDAAIVATATPTHHVYVEKCLTLHIPTLCEKPLSITVESSYELIELSRKNKCALGVNYEFLYATYLQDFKSKIDVMDVSSVEMYWHDPVSEIKYGEVKKSDYSTSIIYDQFSHCCSIIGFLFPENKLSSVDRLNYLANSSVNLICVSDEIEFNFSLSRRSGARKRSICINGELVLDFSIEPGFISLNRVVEKCVWKTHRPLYCSLSSFLNVALNKLSLSDWPALIDNNAYIIQLCAEGEIKLNLAFEQMIQELKDDEMYNAENIQLINLMIDKYVPEAAKRGYRIELNTIFEQHQFAKECIEDPHMIGGK